MVWLFGFDRLCYEFIFLDDVQFEKRSWHQRNYIKLQNKNFINRSSFSKNNRFQKINETK